MIHTGPVPDQQPLVSVVVATYRNAAYIAECLEGILMQRTDFPVEILVGEDESSDGTREICQRYATAHPDRIRLFLRSRKDVIHINGKATGRANLLGLFHEARGRYVAWCDGDDKWTDPLKLSKQVAYLEARPGHALCFHRCHYLKGATLEPMKLPEGVDLQDVRFKDLLDHGNFIASGSMFFRNVLRPLPPWLSRATFADFSINLLLTRHGKLGCVEEYMSAYRISAGALWSQVSADGQDRGHLLFLKVIAPHLQGPAERSALRRRRRLLLDRMAQRRWAGSPWKRWIGKWYLRATQA